MADDVSAELVPFVVAELVDAELVEPELTLTGGDPLSEEDRQEDADVLAMLAEKANTMDPSHPLPLIEGSFALYIGPKKQLILVTETPDRGVERKVFPFRLVKFLAGATIRRMIDKGARDGEPRRLDK
jgi:hypothetical protein